MTTEMTVVITVFQEVSQISLAWFGLAILFKIITNKVWSSSFRSKNAVRMLPPIRKIGT